MTGKEMHMGAFNRRALPETPPQDGPESAEAAIEAVSSLTEQGAGLLAAHGDLAHKTIEAVHAVTTTPLVG
jgi:hypothetical protein